MVPCSSTWARTRPSRSMQERGYEDGVLPKLRRSRGGELTSTSTEHSMSLRRKTLPAVVALVTALALGIPVQAQDSLLVASPNGRNVVAVQVRDGGLYYSVRRDGRAILLPSRLGFEFRGALPLRDSLRITSSAQAMADTIWMQPWGEVTR